MARLYIIDDDEMTCVALSRMAAQMGHEAGYSLLLEPGLDEVGHGQYDLVFLDVMLPDGNGLEALPGIRRTPSSPEVVIITSMGDADGAELAIKSGAWDYVQKPMSMAALRLSLERALKYRQSKRLARPAVALRRGGIMGSSPGIQHCLEQLAEAAGGDVSVLITGPTGTGKEIFARALHDNSPRRSGEFVTVDCASLPPTLVESVLFGHKKGAFTGADRDRRGLVAMAHRGTLFLDEVGEMPLEAQRIFLRVLQERRFRPVGEVREQESDFRLVAATNRDLGARVAEGAFRQDLFFRLRAFTIDLPALKDREGDVSELARHFTHALCRRDGVAAMALSEVFLDVLTGHDWPGNVRELIQTMERAIASARGESVLLPAHLPMELRAKAVRAMVEDRGPDAATRRPGGSGSRASGLAGEDGLSTFKAFRRRRVDDMEREYLQRLAAASGGDVAAARRISGFSKTRLYELLKKHGLSLSDSGGR